MKINIVTVFNSTYIKFAKLFIQSLEENIPREDFGFLYVIDTGIKEEDKQLFNKEYIKIFDSGVNANKYKIHGEDWKKCVDSKVKTIYKSVIKEENIFPLVLIDGDCYFQKPFNDLIDLDYDILLAQRPKNKPKKYIASWVSFNNETSIKFIEEWLKRMKPKKQPPYETDCLISTAKFFDDKIKIKNISTNLISAEKNEKDARILHFKSNGNKSIEDRIKKILK
jgi:hypothetical protein